MTREKFVQITKINIVQAIAISISLTGVITALLNLWLVANLSTIKQDIAVVVHEAKANQDRDDREHPTFVTQNEFLIYQAQIGRIENKVDDVVSILSGRSAETK